MVTTAEGEADMAAEAEGGGNLSRPRERDPVLPFLLFYGGALIG
jgi:hypothetical protein